MPGLLGAAAMGLGSLFKVGIRDSTLARMRANSNNPYRTITYASPSGYGVTTPTL